MIASLAAIRHSARCGTSHAAYYV